MSDIVRINYKMKRKCRLKIREGITISPLTPVSLVVLVLLGHGLAVLAYSAVLIPHEYAHAYVSEKLGYRAVSMRIMPYGISLTGGSCYIKPGDEIRIAAAGPVVNIVMFVFFAALWWLFPVTYAATKGIADASLFTAAVNLLPVYPMDGGRILKSVLKCKFSEKLACTLSRIVGIIVGIAAVAGAFAMIFVGANYTFATLGIFIIASLMLPEEPGCYGRIYAMNDMKRRLCGGLPVREIMVSGDSTAAELFAMLRPDVYTRFIVCDTAGKELFRLDERRLEEIITQFSYSDTVISVANFRRI